MLLLGRALYEPSLFFTFTGTRDLDFIRRLKFTFAKIETSFTSFFFFFYKIRKKRILSATITLATDIEFSIYDDDVLKKEDSVNLNFSDNSDNKSGNEIINYYDKVIFQSVSYI